MASGAAEVTDTTGGAIRSAKDRAARDVPGVATARRTLVLTGGVHEVTGDDPRVVEVKVTAP